MNAYERLEASISSIPFEDHHVHAPAKGKHPIAATGFRRPFTESSYSTVWDAQVPHLIGYRWMVRELADLLEVEPDEAHVIEARNAIDEARYHRLLADAANLGVCYADDLFAPGTSYTIAEWSTLLERPVRRVLRVETFIEQQHARCSNLEDALTVLTETIRSARDTNIVSLKSIAGYRTGLEISPPSSGQFRRAAIAYARLRENLLAGKPDRIDTPELVNTIVWTALEAAAEQALPMQFHVALGDEDIVLTKNDPSLMRALFEHEPFRSVPLVLLHTYPYHRQAAYLAGIYPNVYVDLGLTIPLVGPGASRVVEETLDLAPVNHLLASTDGHETPEFQWFAILVWRRALGLALGKYVTDRVLQETEAIEIAQAVFRENALHIYQQD